MPNIAHFDIVATDVPRAREFYEHVFGWKFSSWSGQPDFFQIETASSGEDIGIGGALTKRADLHPPAIGAFICTISVTSIDETIALVERHGGRITFPKFTIPGVGTMIHFEDSEGNTVGAMQYGAV